MENVNMSAILAENRQRIAVYFRQYDADFGDEQMDVLPRQQVMIDGKSFYLPKCMIDDYPELLKGDLSRIKAYAAGLISKECDSLKKVRRGKAVSSQASLTHNGRMLTALDRVRLQYDFEFWCLTCVEIQDKLTKRMIPFRLNYGQRKTVAEFERQRLSHVPIRIIIVKARQWGGST